MPAASSRPEGVHRPAELRSLTQLDTPTDESSRHETPLAQRVFAVPDALVTFLDEDRQWLTSVKGDPSCESRRDVAFCDHTIPESAARVVPDEHGVDNPLVSGDPSIRFFSAHPIHESSRTDLGARCVIHRRPREASADALMYQATRSKGA
ncbi:MAG: hypothetical protein ACYCRG_01455 [Acidimicrobiales bacterium]